MNAEYLLRLHVLTNAYRIPGNLVKRQSDKVSGVFLCNTFLVPEALLWYNTSRCVFEEEIAVERMNAIPMHTHTRQFYQDRERRAFQKIPGMMEIMSADSLHQDTLMGRYPDAAFAIKIADNIFCKDKEQGVIHQRAYLSILHGENIQDIRFRYDRDMEEYTQRHMWDD